MADAETPSKPYHSFTVADLDGLTIGAAFMNHLIKDTEIQRRVSEVKGRAPYLTHVFDEGRFPVPEINFRWPVAGLLKDQLNVLVSMSAPAADMHENPWGMVKNNAVSGAILHATARLALLIHIFFRHLIDGKVIATGTYFESGSEMPVPINQWSRPGLFVDIRSNDLIEEIGGHLTPRWTGLILSAATSPGISETAVNVGKRDTKRHSSQSSKIKCRDWLVAEMKLSLTKRPENKGEYLKKAMTNAEFPNLSKRSFNWAWFDAITKTGSEWDVAGRPEKSLR